MGFRGGLRPPVTRVCFVLLCLCASAVGSSPRAGFCPPSSTASPTKTSWMARSCSSSRRCGRRT
ncbi:Cellulase containing protein [Zea mays]|uniref:Cellulase containing protein n=1 Tax=Zea mays TaxID=4577 RepID=A0A1D6FNV1_MAIZE|nr:Cellulase containing protein [Zea mays]